MCRDSILCMWQEKLYKTVWECKLNRTEEDEILFVLFRYHLNDLSEPQYLSSGTEDIVFSFSDKYIPEKKSRVWFLDWNQKGPEWIQHIDSQLDMARFYGEAKKLC